ncbi:MAG: DUF1700 domain-containing protein [Clostridia bacterium]|nr:DUF1700 domain-containing protein [Clostridia bacterium]
MTKQEFLSALEVKLSKLPRKDTAERIKFYEEMIDDRVEDGLSEKDAIAELGTVDEIYEQFVKELPLLKIIKERVTPKKKLSGGMIALIASTSIIWFPLLISGLSLTLSLYAVLWSLVLSVWAVFASLAISAPASVISGIVSIFTANITQGLLLIGAGLVIAGLAILAYYASMYVTKGSAILTGKSIIGIKNLIVR